MKHSAASSPAGGGATGDHGRGAAYSAEARQSSTEGGSAYGGKPLQFSLGVPMREHILLVIHVCHRAPKYPL